MNELTKEQLISMLPGWVLEQIEARVDLEKISPVEYGFEWAGMELHASWSDGEDGDGGDVVNVLKDVRFHIWEGTPEGQKALEDHYFNSVETII